MEYTIDHVGEELTDAVTEAFENMAFTEVESCEDVEEIPGDLDAFYVTLDTQAPFRSAVTLIVERDVSEELVMDMYGGDIEEVNDEIMTDALGEIGNTIVGRFLANVVDNKEEFSLGFPDCQPYKPEERTWQAGEGTRIYDLDMDEYHVYCILEWRN
ncbi:MAG: hypothetical protein D6677_03520 [Calditrichaeota bacterium]|nr:MAG: hypothetical protein D6677_03520 [Calditrichota bacterium]